MRNRKGIKLVCRRWFITLACLSEVTHGSTRENKQHRGYQRERRCICMFHRSSQSTKQMTNSLKWHLTSCFNRCVFISLAFTPRFNTSVLVESLYRRKRQQIYLKRTLSNLLLGGILYFPVYSSTFYIFLFLDNFGFLKRGSGLFLSHFDGSPALCKKKKNP